MGGCSVGPNVSGLISVFNHNSSDKTCMQSAAVYFLNSRTNLEAAEANECVVICGGHTIEGLLWHLRSFHITEAKVQSTPSKDTYALEANAPKDDDRSLELRLLYSTKDY